MKRSNLIAGIIFLALAALFTALNLALPEGDVTFMFEGQNMPWVPPVVMLIIGVIILTTGFGKDEEVKREPLVIDEEKAALNKHLETIAWGLFLVMLGCYILVPQSVISRGIWSIGVGLIMLGLNLARYLKDIKMSAFTTVLGVLAIINGVLELLGLNDFEGAIFLIILGLYLLVRPWFDKRGLFGKAEESKTGEE